MDPQPPPPPLPKKTPRTRLSGDERARVAAQLRTHYDQGRTIRYIAQATGRSYNGVRSLLLFAGTRLRASGQRSPLYQRRQRR